MNAVIMDGMRAYFDYVNSQGGVYGRRVKLLIGDDHYNPADTMEVVRKLVEQDKVFAFIGSLGDMASELGAPLRKDSAWFAATKDSPGLPTTRASLPSTRPATTTCAVASACGFNSTGFMSATGATPQARAWSACARPISPPSAVTAALFDMFCGLNGRTRRPRRRSGVATGPWRASWRARWPAWIPR